MFGSPFLSSDSHEDLSKFCNDDELFNEDDNPVSFLGEVVVKPGFLTIDTSTRSLIHQGSSSSLNSNCDSPHTHSTFANRFQQSYNQTPQTPQNKAASLLLPQQSTPTHRGFEFENTLYIPNYINNAVQNIPAQNMEFDLRFRANIFNQFLNENFVVEQNENIIIDNSNMEVDLQSMNRNLLADCNTKIDTPSSPMEMSSVAEEELSPHRRLTHDSHCDSNSGAMQKKSKGRKKSKSIRSETPESPKKPLMPCSIVNCNRHGSRLMESLKGALEQDLKLKPSGRVCEAHYRQDLRAYKKNPSSGLKNDSMSDDEGMKKRKTPSTPTTRSKRGKYF